MKAQLDLHDIQGNIIKAYGRYGYPMSRYLFFKIRRSAGAREFVKSMIPLITHAAQNDMPLVTTNISFTYEGLKRLGIPEATLHGMPDEFSMGMKARRSIVGDTGPNYFTNWDPVWNKTDDPKFNKYDQLTHIFISINGKYVAPDDPTDQMAVGASFAETEARLEEHYLKILALAEQDNDGKGDAVYLMKGHRSDKGDDEPYQRGVAIPDGKEHFGYTDGISSTFFKDSGDDPSRVIGGGKPNGKDPSTTEGWDPIETGEFLLGHKDEADEYPEAAGPPLFSFNGTFLVYRKLHQNVASFEQYLERMGAEYPDGKESFAAKLVGRWRNGAPLVSHPTEDDANALINEIQALQTKVRSQKANDDEKRQLKALNITLRSFDYTDDVEGTRCPYGAHLRRANPRSALMFNKKGAFSTPSALSNRRRVLRRGLPYGKSDPSNLTDDGDHGIIIMLLNADISRQFEFVQQQWFNYGNDFKAANDQDPILGNHGENVDGAGNGRMIIEGDQQQNKPPFLCSGMPTMVETRGGDYYFVPSMTCLQMIARGIVDPT